MQIPQLQTPVIFLPEYVRPQSRAGREVHCIRVSRNVVIAEHRSAAQVQIRRHPPPPLEIPLQPKRIESHPISRIRRLKNQISRHRVHRIFKPPPQNPRQMLSRNHPPIAQPQIKDPRPRSPARHRMPAPSPNLYLMSTLFGPSLRLPKPPTRDQNHKGEDTEKRNQKSPAQTVLSRHGPMRLPDARSFCKAEELPSTGVTRPVVSSGPSSKVLRTLSLPEICRTLEVSAKKAGAPHCEAPNQFSLAGTEVP